MTRQQAIDFLLEMSKYWEKQAISAKEDMAHWASVYNSQNCLNIMEILKKDGQDSLNEH